MLERDGATGDGAAVQVRCWAREESGALPGLTRRWTAVRAAIGPSAIELRASARGSGPEEHPPLVVDVQTAEESGVHRLGWRARLGLGTSQRPVLVTTTAGAHLQLALEPDDVEVVLAVLHGRLVRVPRTPGGPRRPEVVEKRTGPEHLGDRLVEALVGGAEGRRPVGVDVVIEEHFD